MCLPPCCACLSCPQQAWSLAQSPTAPSASKLPSWAGRRAPEVPEPPESRQSLRKPTLTRWAQGLPLARLKLCSPIVPRGAPPTQSSLSLASPSHLRSPFQLSTSAEGSRTPFLSTHAPAASRALLSKAALVLVAGLVVHAQVLSGSHSMLCRASDLLMFEWFLSLRDKKTFWTFYQPSGNLQSGPSAGCIPEPGLGLFWCGRGDTVEGSGFQKSRRLAGSRGSLPTQRGADGLLEPPVSIFLRADEFSFPLGGKPLGRDSLSP